MVSDIPIDLIFLLCFISIWIPWLPAKFHLSYGNRIAELYRFCLVCMNEFQIDFSLRFMMRHLIEPQWLFTNVHPINIKVACIHTASLHSRFSELSFSFTLTYFVNSNNNNNVFIIIFAEIQLNIILCKMGKTKEERKFIVNIVINCSPQYSATQIQFIRLAS